MIDLVKQRFFGSVITDFKVLSSVVLKQVDFTLALFELNNTPNVFEEIYNNERIIDSLDVKLRREMINTVALYNPRATEFRQIMSYYDMTREMERMGDQVMNIAKMVKGIDPTGEISTFYRHDISELLNHAQSMVKQSIDSFSTSDSQLARATIDADDVVDASFHDLLGRLRTENAGKSLNAQQLNDLICIDTIAHSVERIADCATNISEATIYMTEGLDVKHSVPKKDEAIELTGHLPESDIELPKAPTE